MFQSQPVMNQDETGCTLMSVGSNTGNDLCQDNKQQLLVVVIASVATPLCPATTFSRKVLQAVPLMVASSVPCNLR